MGYKGRGEGVYIYIDVYFTPHGHVSPSDIHLIVILFPPTVLVPGVHVVVPSI